MFGGGVKSISSAAGLSGSKSGLCHQLAMWWWTTEFGHPSTKTWVQVTYLWRNPKKYKWMGGKTGARKGGKSPQSVPMGRRLLKRAQLPSGSMKNKAQSCFTKGRGSWDTHTPACELHFLLKYIWLLTTCKFKVAICRYDTCVYCNNNRHCSRQLAPLSHSEQFSLVASIITI